jgi:6-phosphogluconate dehydrogenase
MVHNGIEYADIQLLAEAYHLMHVGLGMSHDEMADVFTTWNQGRLASYLVEITADVMRMTDAGQPLLPRILDAAGQKGTGRWTVESGLGLGVPVSLIAEAVFARAASAMKDERIRAAAAISGPSPLIDGDRTSILADLESALYASKIVSYAQGYMLMRAAASEHEWDLDFGGIALLWREGCIIRAAFLEKIRDAFATDPGLSNLLLDPEVGRIVESAQSGWRRTVSRAVSAGIPVPAYSSALSFFDSYRTALLPANLIQALRDYFGAHTYERTDRPRGEWFHTDWTGTGGDVSAGSYSV